MIIPLFNTDLLIKARDSFLLVGVVKEPFTLFIETRNDEYCQYLNKGDLITVSAPEGGEVRQAEILLELIRTWHTPLMVLSSGHPGSKRLKMVVSAGDQISLNCSIQRGTHPEQTLVCSSEELAGIQLTSTPEGLDLKNLPSCAETYLLSFQGTISSYPGQ